MMRHTVLSGLLVFLGWLIATDGLVRPSEVAAAEQTASGGAVRARGVVIVPTL